MSSIGDLAALGPLDGRYRRSTEPLRRFFSESALCRFRLAIECRYLHFLAAALRAEGVGKGGDASGSRSIVPDVDLDIVLSWAVLDHGEDDAESLSSDASVPSCIPKEHGWRDAHALRIKALERVTNHDVKAVEYFLKERMDAANLRAARELVHFGLTSQDINNTAIPLALKSAIDGVVLPAFRRVHAILMDRAERWLSVPMLAHTHGQPATPTRVGKEFAVFADRLGRQLGQLAQVPHSAKFGGAVGGLNAHVVAFPAVDWVGFADSFVSSLGLERERWTTQISNYDNMAALFDACARANTVLMDLCKDVWQYISMEYLSQSVVETEVGSSAMPHKVNPIDFENAEGNFGMANAILNHLSAKLPISRLQRDLTDSTVLRNVGVPLGHMLVALSSLERGLGKVDLNADAVKRDLEANWLVTSEALQTILRREGYPDPYEALKAVTRTGTHVGRQEIEEFVRGLDIKDSVKAELIAVTPFSFIGAVPDLPSVHRA